MKKGLAVLGILLLFTFVQASATEEDGQKVVEDMMESYTEFYGEFFEDSIESVGDAQGFDMLLKGSKPKEILKQLIDGKLDISISDLLHHLLKILLGEVYDGLKLLVLILTLSVLSSYLTGLKDNFGKEGVTSAAFYTCYIVMAGIASTAFYQTAEYVAQTVEQVALFMKMMVPVLITSLLTCGSIVSASVFEPVIITIVEITVTLVEEIMLPMVMVAAGMNIVNHISERFKTEKLVKFINQCIKWGLSIILTVFVSVAGLKSIASGSADALTLKLSKFATANLIPVVGGILAESVETVMNCSVLIKNSIGVMGILCLVVLSAIPLLKVGGMMILFRLTAAVCEPISEPKMVACLSELANAISVLFSILAIVTVMFIIVLTIVLNAGNTALMLGR